MYSSDDEAPVPDIAASDVQVRTVNRTQERSALRPLARAASPSLADRVSFSVAAKLDGTYERIDEREDVLMTGHWIEDMLVSRETSVPTVFQFHGLQVGVGGRLRDRFSESVCVIANSETTARAIGELSPVDGIVNPGSIQRSSRMPPAARLLRTRTMSSRSVASTARRGSRI